MKKIKEFFIKFFHIPVSINIVWDRQGKVYNLWTGKNPDVIHIYTNLRAVKGGLYNMLIDIKDRPFTLICSKRILNRLFEPDRDKWDF